MRRRISIHRITFIHISHQRIAKDLYKDTQRNAKRIKKNFLQEVDPILQRLDKYNTNHTPKKTCALNYFERMKQKEEKLRKIPKFQKTNLFQESEPITQNQGSRKIYIDEMLRMAEEVQPKSTLRIFPDKLRDHSVDKLLSDNKTPENFEKFSNIKIYSSQGRPSPDLVRYNNKKNIPPCQRENDNDNDNTLLKKLTAQQMQNTMERIFTVSPKFVCLTPRPEKKFSYRINDNVGELLEYKYAPKFREMVSYNKKLYIVEIH